MSNNCKFPIGKAVQIIRTGDINLEGCIGKVVGYHGDLYPIIMFDKQPEGHNPTICIIDACVDIYKPKSDVKYPQTTYTDRFVEAMGLLCTETPPKAMCEAWLFAEDEELQHWVMEGRHKAEWATGIGTIEAAEHMAEHCEEGHYGEGLYYNLSKEDSRTTYEAKLAARLKD